MRVRCVCLNRSDVGSGPAALVLRDRGGAHSRAAVAAGRGGTSPGSDVCPGTGTASIVCVCVCACVRVCMQLWCWCVQRVAC
eukprot:COSAG01_NODE_8831_length_2645_cov_5.119010_2_plen_82_part_00